MMVSHWEVGGRMMIRMISKLQGRVRARPRLRLRRRLRLWVEAVG